MPRGGRRVNDVGWDEDVRDRLTGLASASVDLIAAGFHSAPLRPIEMYSEPRIAHCGVKGPFRGLVQYNVVRDQVSGGATPVLA